MKDIIHSDRGPKPIGPYSQAVKINGLLYLSGQIPLDPKTNEMISGDIKAQTERHHKLILAKRTETDYRKKHHLTEITKAAGKAA